MQDSAAENCCQNTHLLMSALFYSPYLGNGLIDRPEIWHAPNFAEFDKTITKISRFFEFSIRRPSAILDLQKFRKVLENWQTAANMKIEQVVKVI